MANEFLRLNRVDVKRGGRCVVRAPSLSFDVGQVVAIIGENGAGKSTLLKALAGDMRYSGQIYLAGRNVSDWSQSELASVRAVMEQQPFTPAGLTVTELVALGRYWRHESEAQSMKHALCWLEHLQLTDLAHRELTALSGGEQQRAHLARCMTQLDHKEKRQPGMLLLDEPTAALDVFHQHLCMKHAQSFARQGNLVIAVMHDLNLASLYADQILLLHHGEPCACGDPVSVLQPERLQQLYNQPMHVCAHPTLRVPMIFPEPHLADGSASHY